MTFQITTVDTLFANRPLGFAHWDVEGMEVPVIQGALATIRRDRPWFTVEAFPLTHHGKYVNLVRLVHSLGYRMYEIFDTCGYPFDCRNYLCVPNERDAAFMSVPNVTWSAWMR